MDMIHTAYYQLCSGPSNPNLIEYMQQEEETYRLPTLEDLDQMFYNNHRAIIANNVSFSGEAFAEELAELIYQNNKREDVGFVAECDCGHMVGDYYDDGIIQCPKCGELVTTNFVESLQHKVWISTPEDIKAWLHPTAYLVLSDWLKRNSENYLDLILNVNAELPEELDGIITGQGFNYLYDNFDMIMEYFLNVHYKTKSKPKTPDIRWFLDKYRDVMWCTKLPVLSNELHPITKAGRSLSYADGSSHDIMTAIIDLANIQFQKKVTVTSASKLQYVMFTTYKSYINYLTKIIKDKLATKPGLIRKHMFGTRLHGTFRTVVVPINSQHQTDEIHIPWKVGINTYKHMIINVLINRQGYTVQNALIKVHRAMCKYDHDIALIFKTLIDEASCNMIDPETKRRKRVNLPGLPCIMNRNPTLHHQSIQMVFVTRVKPFDVEYVEGMDVSIGDDTTSVSPSSCKGLNMDFDGDSINYIAIYEMSMVPAFMNFHLSRSMLSTSKPEVDVSMVSLSKQHLVVYNKWLRDQ